MYRIINTNSYLHKCGMQLDNLCIFCNQEAETIEQYIFYCSFKVCSPQIAAILLMRHKAPTNQSV